MSGEHVLHSSRLVMKYIALFFAALMLSSAPAWAWATVSGTVAGVDMAARTVTLDNGNTYHLDDNLGDVAITDINSGDKVVLSIDTDHNNRVTRVQLVGK